MVGRPRKRSRRAAAVGWSLMAFGAIGYLPTFLTGTPVLAMTAASCLIIPYGNKSKSVRQAILRGLGLGLVAGVGIWSAFSGGGPLPPEHARRAAIYVVAPAIMCAVVSAVFFHMARTRRELQERR